MQADLSRPHKDIDLPETLSDLTGKRDDGTLTFSTAYSEKGRKTKLDDIMRQLHKLGVEVKEESVERAFRVFERQSEVDYFINKNARAFLREQFDLWMFQYVFSGESEWTEQRIKQLQVLKDIALGSPEFVKSPETARIKNVSLSPLATMEPGEVSPNYPIAVQPALEVLEWVKHRQSCD